MISIIHPSRGRPEKSYATIAQWSRHLVSFTDFEFIISLDDDDPRLEDYKRVYLKTDIILNKNRSCVDAINNAAKCAHGDVLIVVSDDTASFPGWPRDLLKELEGKSDYLLKTDDGIQDYIVTMTVMDRKYYERDGFIYHPDFKHQFADTYLTCLADIRGRLIFSNLKFPHLHYSHSSGKEIPDELHRRNDATWMEGQDTFVRLMKQFPSSDLRKIKDVSMQNWLRNHGVK